jgi:hypothetical protein
MIPISFHVAACRIGVMGGEQASGVLQHIGNNESDGSLASRFEQENSAGTVLHIFGTTELSTRPKHLISWDWPFRSP